MNSLDLLSRRMLVFAISLSALLLSGSLFLFSIQTLRAEPRLPHLPAEQLLQYVPQNSAVVSTQEAVYIIRFSGDQPSGVWRADAESWGPLAFD